MEQLLRDILREMKKMNETLERIEAVTNDIDSQM